MNALSHRQFLLLLACAWSPNAAAMPQCDHLKFVENHPNEAGGAEGLHGTIGVSVSPDGAHVYVVSGGLSINNDHFDGTVTVFERDGITGALTFVEFLTSGEGGVPEDGLTGAKSLVLGPDGGHVYVIRGATTTGPATILVFERDQANGTLALVEIQADGVGSLEGVPGQRPMALAPDGAHLYQAGREETISIFERDGTVGALTLAEQLDVSAIEGVDEPSAIALSSDGAHLYVTSSRHTGNPDHPGGSVGAFRRDPVTGLLTLVEVEVEGVDGVDGVNQARACVLSPDDDDLYVVGPGDESNDSLAVFDCDPVTGELIWVEVHRNGVGGVDGLDNPVDLALAPDGSHVYVAVQESDTLAMFEREASTGQLDFVGALGVEDHHGFLGGASSVAVSPDGRHVYAAAKFPLSGGVSVFRVNDDCGGQVYCDESQNPANAADIGIDGCDLSSPRLVGLSSGPPGQFAYLVIGSGGGSVHAPPGSEGDLCVVGGSCLGRYAKDVGAIDANGTFSTDVSSSISGGPGFGIPTCGGSIQSGETWYFQYWHRQPLGQPSTFSSAMCVTFQ